MQLGHKKGLARSACVAATLALTLLAGAAGAASPVTGQRLAAKATKLKAEPVRAANREIEVFVRLDEPADFSLRALFHASLGNSH